MMPMDEKLLGCRCDKPDHGGEVCSYVCYEEECSNRGMVCVLCLYESHHHHAVKPIKDILGQMKKDQEEAQQHISMMAKIDHQTHNTLQLIQSIPDDSLRLLVHGTASMYFAHVAEQTKSHSHFRETSKICSNQARNKVFLNYIANTEALNPDNLPHSNYYLQLKKLHEDISEKEQHLSQCLKSGTLDDSITGQFDLSSGFSSKKFTFSEKCRHQNLIYENSTKIKMTGYVDDYNYLVLCEPAISPAKTQRITFQLTNLSCYVTLGICFKKKVQNNYQLMTNGSGHGFYHMSYDGYSWSDSDSSANDHYTGWYFNQGDKVTLQCSIKQKKLTFFRNNDENNPYVMNIEPHKGDKLYFSVSFNSEPEQVDIIY